jgi:hypothetical protein
VDSVPGLVSPGATGAAPQAQQNQQDMLRQLNQRVLEGIKRIQEKQQQLVQLQTELQRETDEVQKLLVEQQKLQEGLAVGQEQQYGQLQQQHTGLEQQHGRLREDHDRLQREHGQLEIDHGKLEVRCGQLNQQVGELRQQQYTRSQPSLQLQPPQQLQQPPQHQQLQQPQQVQQLQQHQPLLQQPQQLQPPQQLVQQQPFQDSQLRPPSRGQYALPQQFTVYPTPQHQAQQHPSSQHPTLHHPIPQYAAVQYQTPQIPTSQQQYGGQLSQDELIPFFLDEQSYADLGFPGAYAPPVRPSPSIPEHQPGQLGSSGGRAHKRARDTQNTGNDVSETAGTGAKRQRTGPSHVWDAPLQAALNGAPASAVDAIEHLNSYADASFPGSLAVAMSEQDLVRYIRHLEAWVDLIASRGGDAMPVMMFGFDQLARKWTSAQGAQNNAGRQIPKNMLRSDTPESFRALWRTSLAAYDPTVDGGSGMYRAGGWRTFRTAVESACRLKKHDLESARFPMSGGSGAGSATADQAAVERWSTELRKLPFKWGFGLARLGERRSAAGMTTTTTATAATTTTTTTTERDRNAS